MILDRNGVPMISAKAETGLNKMNPAEIIAKIASGFKDRSRQDIQEWRSAISMAEHPETPIRKPLMDIYDNLISDGNLQAQLRLRKSVVLSKAFYVENDKGEVDPEQTKLLNSKWFFDLLDHYIMSELYGYSLIEITSFVNGRPKLELIPRQNVIPSLGRVLLDLGNPELFLDYRAPVHENWLIEMGESDNLGIMHNIVPNLIWKRNIMQSWAEFCERFGIPFMSATTNRSDAKTIEDIQNMLVQLGEAAHGVFPQGTTIDMKEANRTDAFQTFDKFCERNDNEINKAINGGTMITDNGSSRSQSEVHERNMEERLGGSDRREITFFINETFLPILTYHGFPFNETSSFSFDHSEELSLSEYWKIVKGMLDKDLDIDLEWMSKTFSIPVVGRVKKDEPTITAMLERYGGFVPTGSPKAAVNNFELDVLHQMLIEAIYNNEDTTFIAAKIIAIENGMLFDGLKSGYGDTLQTAWNADDHLMLSLMEQNLLDFSSSKTEKRLAHTKEFLIDPETNKLRSYSDFKRVATEGLSKFNENWLKTEYNLSVSIGQNSAAFQRAWAEREDFPFVQFITAGDSNVRSAHAALEGKVFNINDAEARSIWPPNDFGCRCEMGQYAGTPSDAQLMKGSEGVSALGEKFAKSDFKVNRGEVGKVFLKEQMYGPKKDIASKVSKLSHESWGLENYSDKKDLFSIPIDKTISKENVKELFKSVANKVAIMQVTDYLKRRISLSKSTFDKYTKGKYLSEGRHQLFPAALKVLESPDEVWMYEYGEKMKLRSIVFYSENMVVVDTEIGKYGQEIQTWYTSTDDAIRKGLLLKSN